MDNRLLAADLYRYLLELGELLAAKGEATLAKRVRSLSKFASGSTSELYGESRLELPLVLRDGHGALSGGKRGVLREVISLIERSSVVSAVLREFGLTPVCGPASTAVTATLLLLDDRGRNAYRFAR